MPAPNKCWKTLESIVGNIGDCSLSVVPQNSASAKKQAERGIREKLMDELGELAMRMKALFDDGRKRAPSGVAVDHLLASFVDLRCQAQMYCDALQIEMDVVMDNIDQLQTGAAKLHTNDKPSEKAATMKVRESIVEKFQTMLTQNDYRDGQTVVFDEHQMEKRRDLQNRQDHGQILPRGNRTHACGQRVPSIGVVGPFGCV